MAETTGPRRDGVPTWIDLTVTNVDANREFLATAFGWTTPPGTPEYGGYTCSQVGGRLVCGVAPSMTAEGEPQIIDSDYLTVYLASADLETTLAKVIEAGGSVMVDPMDVPNSGRMAIALDPQGNQFGLWQADEMVGFAAESELGFPDWFELFTSDPQAAAEFYSEVFGLTLNPMEVSGQSYLLTDDFGILPGEHGWMAYIHSDNIEGSLAKAVESGASVVVPVTAFQFGSYTDLRTPGGARLGIFQSPAAQ